MATINSDYAVGDYIDDCEDVCGDVYRGVIIEKVDDHYIIETYGTYSSKNVEVWLFNYEEEIN